MRSSSREEIVEVLDALEADYKRALDVTFDVLTTPERLRVLERFEGFRRQQPAIEHALINQLAAQADATELGGKLAPALAEPVADQPRRGRHAVFMRPPIWVSGGRLNGNPCRRCCPRPPQAQRNGELGAGHVAVIRSFFHRLPDFVDVETRAKAEAQLAAPEPASIAPMSWPSWPTNSPTASTPTATSPTSTAPNAAASSSANKTSTA